MARTREDAPNPYEALPIIIEYKGAGGLPTATFFRRRPASAARTDWPDWLPQLIAIEAETFGNPTPADVQRLATDPRVRIVWQELLKRDRRTGVPKYPAAHSEEEPNCLQFLFRTAIVIYRGEYATRGRLAEDIRRLREYAIQLREIVEGHKRFAEYADYSTAGVFFGLDSTGAFFNLSSQMDVLGRLAAAYEQFADILARLPEAVIRERTDPQLHGFIARFSRATKTFFDTPLYGVVATVASVLFERPVKPILVRSISRGMYLRPVSDLP
jgi:hypothetical protein